MELRNFKMLFSLFCKAIIIFLIFLIISQTNSFYKTILFWVLDGWRKFFTFALAEREALEPGGLLKSVGSKFPSKNCSK